METGDMQEITSKDSVWKSISDLAFLSTVIATPGSTASKFLLEAFDANIADGLAWKMKPV